MKKKPIRMCIVCKNRFYQNELNRLQCKNSKLIKWEGKGRSFYICKECINDKKLIKYIANLCKISKEKAKNEILNIFIVN